MEKIALRTCDVRDAIGVLRQISSIELTRNLTDYSQRPRNRNEDILLKDSIAFDGRNTSTGTNSISSSDTVPGRMSTILT